MNAPHLTFTSPYLARYYTPTVRTCPLCGIPRRLYLFRRIADNVWNKSILCDTCNYCALPALRLPPSHPTSAAAATPLGPTALAALHSAISTGENTHAHPEPHAPSLRITYHNPRLRAARPNQIRTLIENKTAQINNAKSSARIKYNTKLRRQNWDSALLSPLKKEIRRVTEHLNPHPFSSRPRPLPPAPADSSSSPNPSLRALYDFLHYYLHSVLLPILAGAQRALVLAQTAAAHPALSSLASPSLSTPPAHASLTPTQEQSNPVHYLSSPHTTLRTLRSLYADTSLAPSSNTKDWAFLNWEA